MGYDKSRFLQNIPESFCCGICRDVLLDPIQCPREHMFCTPCMAQALEHNKECPACRIPLIIENCVPISRAIRELLNESDIRCSHDDIGCTSVVKLEQIEEHERNCPVKECQILRGQLQESEAVVRALYSNVFQKGDEIQKLKETLKRKKRTIVVVAKLLTIEEKKVGKMNGIIRDITASKNRLLDIQVKNTTRSKAFSELVNTQVSFRGVVINEALINEILDAYLTKSLQVSIIEADQKFGPFDKYIYKNTVTVLKDLNSSLTNGTRVMFYKCSGSLGVAVISLLVGKNGRVFVCKLGMPESASEHWGKSLKNIVVYDRIDALDVNDLFDLIIVSKLTETKKSELPAFLLKKGRIYEADTKRFYKFVKT